MPGNTPVLLVLLAAFGASIAYRGWWMYEQFLILSGFVLGAVFGALFSWTVGVDGLVVVVVVLVCGGVGAVSYWQLHVVFVVLPGFIGGLLVGSVLFGVQLGDWTHPLVLLAGVGGAVVAWAVHRALVVGTTAVIGGYIVGKVAVMWPVFSYSALFEGGVSSGWFAVVCLTGIGVQYRVLTLEDEREERVDPWEEVRAVTVQFDESVGRLLKGEVPTRDLFGNPPTHLLGRYYVRCPTCDRFAQDDWKYCQRCGELLTDTDS